MKKIVLLLIVLSLALTACTSKPSKGEVRDAFQAQIEQTTEVNTPEARKAVDTFVECFVDAIYDDVDAETLRKFVDADPAEGRDPFTKDQEEIGNKALELCSSELVEKN